MKPLYFTLTNKLRLLIVPDTQANLNGHVIITHTYSIFRDAGEDNPLFARTKESTLHLDEIKDPDYYGFITFDIPGRVFSYTSDGKRQLTSNETTEVIDHLNNVRDNPALWDLSI